jgi:hypothetical protein
VTTPAADEVDDFELVAIFKNDLGPAIAGSDISIEFDRDAIGLHIKGFDQGRQRERGGGRGIGEGARFAVDVKVHGGTIAARKRAGDQFSRHRAVDLEAEIQG